MKVLVTGGAGFIGSHIVDTVLSNGHSVKVLDNLYSGNFENIERHEDDSSFRFIEGDIRNEDDVEEALTEVDAVFHEAAITSVPVSVENPELTREVNVGGTANLLEESLAGDVDRFVFASSCAVYGEPEDLPLTESSPVDPESPYAESKLDAEKECREYSENGLETVILRYFNVYGPGQSGGRYAGVISKFLERLAEEKAPIIYGDGKQTRDFVYVDDVVKANLLSLETEGLCGHVFNVGTGSSISVNELCEVLLELTGNEDIDPVYEDERAGDVRHSESDIGKIKEKMGYTPEISLRKGLKKIVESSDRLDGPSN